MTDKWYYWGDGDACGPISLDDMTDRVRSGQVNAKTDIRRETEIGWTAAEAALPDLFAVPGQSRPKSAKAGWIDTHPHPWRRFMARMTDNLIVGFLAWAFIGMVAYALAPEPAERLFSIFHGPGGAIYDLVLSGLIVIPLNALTIGYTGLSLGKWIFGVRVLRDGYPIGFVAALRRELSIWVIGRAFGLPLAATVAE